jgi:hypothetical protein
MSRLPPTVMPAGRPIQLSLQVDGNCSVRPGGQNPNWVVFRSGARGSAHSCLP